MVPVYVVIAVPPALAGVAIVIATIRAKKEDLPDIVRALMRIGPRDSERDDRPNDEGVKPPSLPQA